MSRELPNSGLPLVMGVVNVTPDSFFDGGEHLEPEKAIEHGLRLVKAGADIIDIGGESTRPGSLPADVNEELRRVLPVVAGIRARSGAFISVDTRKAAVAEAAVDGGADMINDISGLAGDGEMARVARRSDVYVVIMHIRGTPADMQDNPGYGDTLGEIEAYFAERLRFAEGQGLRPHRIVIDPGIGYGKRLADNLKILKELARLRRFGKPVLVGTSMKSFIGEVTGRGVAERLPGTLASVALALWNGADIVRVHDVGAARQVVDLVSAVRKA